MTKTASDDLFGKGFSQSHRFLDEGLVVFLKVDRKLPIVLNKARARIDASKSIEFRSYVEGLSRFGLKKLAKKIISNSKIREPL